MTLALQAKLLWEAAQLDPRGTGCSRDVPVGAALWEEPGWYLTRASSQVTLRHEGPRR
jgi:hypothetical protein